MARTLLTRSVITFVLAFLSAVPVRAQSGTFLHDLTIYDDRQGNALSGPAGVACDGGRLLIADSLNNRLLLYTLGDGDISLTGETKLLRQIRPTTVQFVAGGDLLVYDSKSKEILQFDSKGNQTGKVQPREVPPGTRIIPRSFRVDGSGNIYLLDIYGGRIVILDNTGTFVRQIPFPEESGFFSDLAVDGRGRVFILDSVRSQVFAAEPGADAFAPLSENLQDTLVFPTHMEVDGKGMLYIVDEESGCVVTLRRDGSLAGKLFNRGRKEGLLYYPSQICVGDGGRIFIADRDNNRVQVFKEKE